MAGRPGGSNTGLLIGLFTSVGIALIALVLLVVLWTKQEKLVAEAQRADQDTEKVMTAGEKQGVFKTWFDQATGGASVAKAMNDEMVAMAALLTPDATAITPGYSKQLTSTRIKTFWDEIKNDKMVDDPVAITDKPLLDGFAELYKVFKLEREKNLEAQKSITQLTQDREQLSKTNQENQDQFEGKATELQTQLAGFESEWQSYRAEKQSVIDQAMQASNQRSAENATQQQSLRQQIDDLNTELGNKQAKNEELVEKLREFQILPQPRMAARQSDGEILLAKPGEGVVFINLGRKDHLTPGLRFAVYSPDTGIPSTGNAKAAIEVTNIGDEVSQCKIVRTDIMYPIIEGDLVANPIYDRARQLRFVILGEFDLDHDGRDDNNGPGVIASVIGEMGGVVTEELNARTDFLIVGARPVIRSLEKDASPEAMAIHDEEKIRVASYESHLKEALSLSIPVLTQETFLNFLGRI